MNNYRRFKFVKELKKSETEKIPVGSEITVLNDTIYFNGGMITPTNYNYFNKLLANEIAYPYYLQEVIIPVDKV